MTSILRNINQKLALIFPYIISVNDYLEYKVGHMRKGAKSYNRVIPYQSKETKEAYKKWLPYVRQEVKKQGWNIPEDNLFVVVETKYFFKQKKTDANNCSKVMFDILTSSEVVWKDDCVAYEVCRGVYYDKNNPRVEITLRISDQRGIFNTDEEMKEFENKCSKCSYYRNGSCKILNEAKEGRIQEIIIKELIDNKQFKICKKFKNKKGGSNGD